MRPLEKTDLDWCVRRLPVFLTKILQKEPGVCVAGGFIRDAITRDKPADIDLFVTKKEHAKPLAQKIAGDNGDARLHETDNAITVRLKGPYPPVQVIHRWTFEHPELILPSFDFTIAKAAIWFEESDRKWQSLCDDRFYTDLAARRLVYTHPQRHEDAGGSILRVLKFYQRGYRVPLDSLAGVMARMMMGVDGLEFPETPAFADKESGLAQVLAGLLYEVDPLLTANDHIEKKGAEETT